MNNFVTLDSGNRINYPSGLNRDIEEGKPRYDLLLPLKQSCDETLLYRWAMLMERGMTKYGYRNWEKANSVEELNRFKASAWRHFIQAMNGENHEDHFAAVCFNLNAIVYVMDKIKCDINGETLSEVEIYG